MRRLGIIGLVLSLVGLGSYFAVVFVVGAQFPAVRNFATPNRWLVGIGTALAVLGYVRAGAGRRRGPAVLVALNLVAAGLLGWVLYLVPAVPMAEGPPVGVAAPAFALTDQAGRGVALADFRGSPLLLVFYRGHW